MFSELFGANAWIRRLRLPPGEPSIMMAPMDSSALACLFSHCEVGRGARLVSALEWFIVTFSLSTPRNATINFDASYSISYSTHLSIKLLQIPILFGSRCGGFMGAAEWRCDIVVQCE